MTDNWDELGRRGIVWGSLGHRKGTFWLLARLRVGKVGRQTRSIGHIEGIYGTFLRGHLRELFSNMCLMYGVKTP